MRPAAVPTEAAEGGYFALNPETGTVSQGETMEEFIGNLREAVELYLEEFPMGSSVGRAAPFVTMFDVADA